MQGRGFGLQTSIWIQHCFLQFLLGLTLCIWLAPSLCAYFCGVGDFRGSGLRRSALGTAFGRWISVDDKILVLGSSILPMFRPLDWLPLQNTGATQLSPDGPSVGTFASWQTSLHKQLLSTICVVHPGSWFSKLI